MNTYLVAYDLAATSANRHAVAGAIMQIGERWARPLQQSWYVTTALPAEEIEARLRPLLDAEDGLVVQRVRDEALIVNTALRWFRRRRPEADVVPFPQAA